MYVSCNPATQARDLQLLDENTKVKAIQPVDMFPHTHHVENVVLLELQIIRDDNRISKEKKKWEKRPRRTPAEKARAQYTNYAVKRTHGTNGVPGYQDAGRKSYEIKIVVKQTGCIC